MPGFPIHDLGNDEMRAFMDTVHSLRSAGLEDLLQLPQIVVCGDRSSGKSSVLEAITNIPFPRDTGMCTCFPIAITLRRAETESATVKIIPDPKRTYTEKELKAIGRYDRTLSSFSQLPLIIHQVTQLIVPAGNDDERNLAFARDTLSIEVSGPDLPNLTVVDLPGIIRATDDQQNREDIAMINDIIDSYIMQERTVVLAVIQASVDQPTQDITEKIKNLGANDRTMGVITKPDFLEPGSKEERLWVDLAYNRKGVDLMGWHVLKNRYMCP